MTRRALVPVLVLLGAAAVAGGALPRWWTVRWDSSMLGEQVSTLTGRQTSPALLVTALVAVAGLGAVAAARGLLRRAIGLLVAVAGVLAVAAAWSAAATVPGEVISETNHQVQRILGGDRSLFGPVLCGIGGLLVMVGGLLVLAGRFVGRGMGTRFDRSDPRSVPGGVSGPGDGPPAEPGDAAGPGTAGTASDQDAATLWRALDAGADPTAEPTAPRPPAPNPPEHHPSDPPGRHPPGRPGSGPPTGGAR